MMNMMGGYGCATTNSKRMTSALAGALAAYTGADTLFTGFGAPRELHWGLAGLVVDIGCRGANTVVDPIMETGISAVAGYAGAMLAQRFLPKLL